MKLRIALILAVVLASAGTAQAAADEQATKWLERVFGLVQDKAFQTDYSVQVSGETQGVLVDAKLQGELLQSGAKHYTNALQMEVKMPAMGETPMEVTSNQVSDGEILWTETYVSAMGITQVAKISLSELEEILADQQGLEVGQSSMYMDPMSQLEMLVDAFDVSVLKIAEGEVSLALSATEETRAQFAELEDPEISGVLVVREEDAVPVSINVAIGTSMTVDMRFEGFELMAPEDVPGDAFVYTPEPGVQVMDLGQMLRAGM
jgi:outer membrane lipoprotein-sorting protein